MFDLGYEECKSIICNRPSREFFLSKSQVDQNIYPAKSNFTAVEQSLGLVEEAQEERTKLLSASHHSAEKAKPSSSGKEMMPKATIQKSQIGSKISSLDLLFHTAARSATEGAILPKIMCLLKGLKTIMGPKLLEFVIFSKDTRMVMLEMFPE